MLGVRVAEGPWTERPDVITDLAARRIASDWHAGGGSPSYQFVSTGRIVPELEAELLATLRGCCRMRDFPWTALGELNELILYVRTYGPRDAVENWSLLTW